MTNDFEREWASLFPLWLKHCGVSDEYATLKSKWRYLSQGFSSLPEIDTTFERMDDLIQSTNVLFRPFFDRKTNDTISNFDRSIAPQKINKLQETFFEIAHYLGLLKFVFYQRTVSSEIPHVVSGVPLSPERTVGNELIYLAADKLTERYSNCVMLDPQMSWDKAISFVYPIQDLYFFGGFCRPNNYLKLFHISLSEEGKHFLGSYLMLAHEVSHAVHYVWDDDGFYLPKWLKEIFSWCHAHQLQNFGDAVLEMEEVCQDCKYYQNLLALFSLDANRSMFLQFIADLIAYEIGGPTTIFSFIDLFLNSKFLRHKPLRPAFLLGYLTSAGRNDEASKIDAEVNEMQTNWLNYIRENTEELNAKCIMDGIDPTCICFKMFKNIGLLTGKEFFEKDKEIFNFSRTLELPVRLQYNPDTFDSVISALIKDKFEITSDEEAEIKQKLIDRVTCEDVDPRKILHCFYLLHRMNANAPDYAITLSSIAFNEFK